MSSYICNKCNRSSNIRADICCMCCILYCEPCLYLYEILIGVYDKHTGELLLMCDDCYKVFLEMTHGSQNRYI